MEWIGIDPGKSGSIAIIQSDHSYRTLKLSAPTDVIVDFLRYGTWGEVYCCLEKVGARPKQGVVSTFKFGQSYGFLKGLLAALDIRYDEVTPQRWQKTLGCLTGGDKNVTKMKAQELFPNIKCTHANSDALLIAEYCRRMHG